MFGGHFCGKRDLKELGPNDHSKVHARSYARGHMLTQTGALTSMHKHTQTNRQTYRHCFGDLDEADIVGIGEEGGDGSTVRLVRLLVRIRPARRIS